MRTLRLSLAALCAALMTVMLFGTPAQAARVGPYPIRLLGYDLCVTPSDLDNARGPLELQECVNDHPAQAWWWQNGNRWQNENFWAEYEYGGYLDADLSQNGASGSIVHTWTFVNGASNQFWRNLSTDYTVRTTINGKDRCLDAYAPSGVVGPNTPVKIYDCHGRWNQRWVFYLVD